MSCATVLKEKGFKLTPQRRLIVEYLHDNDAHLTAEEILNYLESRAPGVNKSTVYRTLELLEEAGCVLKSEIDGHFIYHHAEEGHHHHLVCVGCGKSVDCNENIFSGVKRTLAEKYGFNADMKHMMINGLCEDCRKKHR
jgi:Fur family ferric uptake transcriptional regulator